MLGSLVTLAQSSSSSSGGAAGDIGAIIFLFVYLGILVLLVAGLWKVFSKAGQPGWGAIVPILNMYFWCKLVGRPGWWVILLFVPIVSLVITIILCNDLAKSFGKGIGYTVGIIFLPFVFIPMLGFGSAQYQGPAAAS